MKHPTRPIARATAAASLVAAVAAPAPAFASYLGYSDLSGSHWAVIGGVVDWAEESGIIHGSNGKWRPDATVTRAEAAAIIWNYHGNPAPKKPAAFTDAGSLSWARDAVAWCSEQGIFTGDASTGNFNPWAPLTREQSAKVLCVMADGRIPATVSFGGFKDFNSVSKWAWGVMGWAVENGIVTGVQKPDGAYLAGQSGCTRAEFATMLRRVEDKYGAPDKPADPGQGGTGSGDGNTGSGGSTGGGSADKPMTPTDPKPGDVDPITGKVWGVVKPAWTEKLWISIFSQAMEPVLSSVKRGSALGIASIMDFTMSTLSITSSPSTPPSTAGSNLLQTSPKPSPRPRATMRGAFLCKPQGRLGRAVRRGAGDMPPRGASICCMGPFR